MRFKIILLVLLVAVAAFLASSQERPFGGGGGGGGGGSGTVTSGATNVWLTYTGSNLLINLASYSNVANLSFSVVCTNNLQFAFSNSLDGQNFSLNTFNGSALTNGAFPNTALASTNLYPIQTNTFGYTDIIPTTSTNSHLRWSFTANQTNVDLNAQSSFAY